MENFTVKNGGDLRTLKDYNFLKNHTKNLASNSTEVHDVIFEGDISNGDYIFLTFEKCKFLESLNLINTPWVGNGTLTLKKSEVNKLILNEVLKNKNYDIKFDNTEFTNLELDGFHSLDIFFDKIDNLNFQKNIKLVFKDNFEYLKLLSLDSNTKLGKVSLFFINEKDTVQEVTLRNLRIDSLYIINCNFNDSFCLTDIKIDNLIISNSNLGKTIFNGVKIGKLTLENATLNDCIFNGVTFESYELGNKIDGKKVPLERLKDNYRQLKYVMDKNNNYIEANKFYELEMETYMRIIYGVEKISIFSIFDIFSQKFVGMKSKNLSSFIQLYFGYQISEFGNNWLRVISLFFILAIVSTSLGFASYLFSLGNEGYYLIKPSLVYIGSSAHFFKTYNYISSNLFGDFVVLSIIVCCFLASIIYKYFISKYFSGLINLRKVKYIKGIIKYIGSKFRIFGKIIGVLFLLLVLFFAYTSNYNFIGNFLNYLMPLYGFNLEDLKTYNAIELLGLIVYKLIYILLLSHLVIALKRTTKR